MISVDLKNTLLARIDIVFKTVDITKAFRQFPIWGSGDLLSDEIFNFDWLNFDPIKLDQYFDIWLCFSAEGFRGFSNPALKAILNNPDRADESAVIGGYLSCISEDPSTWLAEFSGEELETLIDCLNYFANNSKSKDDYLYIIEAVKQFIRQNRTTF